jgi:hypothetical protein
VKHPRSDLRLEGMTRPHALVTEHMPDDQADLDPGEAAGRVKGGFETGRGSWVGSPGRGRPSGVRDQPDAGGPPPRAAFDLGGEVGRRRWAPVGRDRPAGPGAPSAGGRRLLSGGPWVRRVGRGAPKLGPGQVGRPAARAQHPRWIGLIGQARNDSPSTARSVRPGPPRCPGPVSVPASGRAAWRDHLDSRRAAGRQLWMPDYSTGDPAAIGPAGGSVSARTTRRPGRTTR